MVPGFSAQRQHRVPAWERVPLLLIHGDSDPIAAPAASQAFFKKVEIEDIPLKLYEGGYHQTFIDSNREQVLADVAEWLDGRA